MMSAEVRGGRLSEPCRAPRCRELSSSAILGESSPSVSDDKVVVLPGPRDLAAEASAYNLAG